MSTVARAKGKGSSTNPTTLDEGVTLTISPHFFLEMSVAFHSIRQKLRKRTRRLASMYDLTTSFHWPASPSCCDWNLKRGGSQ